MLCYKWEHCIVLTTFPVFNNRIRFLPCHAPSADCWLNTQLAFNRWCLWLGFACIWMFCSRTCQSLLPRAPLPETLPGRDSALFRQTGLGTPQAGTPYQSHSAHQHMTVFRSWIEDAAHSLWSLCKLIETGGGRGGSFYTMSVAVVWRTHSELWYMVSFWYQIFLSLTKLISQLSKLKKKLNCIQGMGCRSVQRVCVACVKPWIWPPVLHKLDVIVCSCKPST